MKKLANVICDEQKDTTIAAVMKDAKPIAFHDIHKKRKTRSKPEVHIDTYKQKHRNSLCNFF
jgi:hypothetical protein